MKKQLFSISLSVMLLLSGMSVFAQTTYQCNLPNSTPIQCGYYQEGYQDGLNDAQSNRNSDYRRYRSKLDGNKYESFYRQGYDAGFSSINLGSRWSTQQRSAYDRGYTQGQSDRRLNRSRNPNQWNQTLPEYYSQGYSDGYDGRNRQYDTVITNPTNPGFPGFPGGGSQSGTLSWSGRVDDRVNIIIQGRNVRHQTIAGSNPTGVSQNMSGSLPNRPATISVNKRNGRGEATVIQQPNRSNNFTAIVQVYDSRGGADNYNLDISWQSSTPVEEPYQSGRVTWRGRVDQNANIIISGNSVETQNISGAALSGVSHNITGYLAYRPGSVNVRKIRGRGTVSVLQQPNASNDYVAIIQVLDPDRAAGDYELEITW